jgi:Carboxypeptidase controlling helical cell shape catalytic
MEDHRRYRSLRLRWFLLAGVFGLFFLGDVLKNYSYEKRGRELLSETKTFFKGSDQEVDVYHLQGREGGPTVLIFAGIHGDESGGYLTADRYADLKVLKGNLIVVPRLNLFAILAKKRIGLSGQDMNRKFQPREESEDPDNKVVGLAKSLMDQADIILHLHQGYGFYSPVWIDGTRNPIRWGQCKVIDAPTFDLPGGRRLELEHFARKVTGKINSQIADKKYHFQVNNTNTSHEQSLHKEQRKSLTYYALAEKHKMAFGIEATKNCTFPQSVSYLTIAVNAIMESAGIVVETFPCTSPEAIANELKRNEEFRGLFVKINDRKRLILPDQEISLTSGDRFQILSVEAKHPRGWYPFLLGSKSYNDVGKEFSIRQASKLVLQKNGKRIAVFPIRIREDLSKEHVAGI